MGTQHTPHLLFPGIFCDSLVSNLSCENSSPDISTSNHSQNTPDVNLSFLYGEDTSFFPNPPNLASFHSRNAEDEHSCFLSTPLYDSSYHEDFDERIKFSDRGYCDLFIPSFDHDVDSLVFDLSKPPIFDHLPDDEVETP